MNNATIYRDEYRMAQADFEKAVTEIQNSTVFAIVGALLHLRKKGVRASICFEADHISIFDGERFIGGDVQLASAEQLIGALAELEEMDKQADTVDDISLLFSKEEDTPC